MNPAVIGIFGGTFDPVHQGHLRAVSLLCESITFSQVHWVLSARPPHKTAMTASIQERFAMLQLALANHANFIADDTEISRCEKSYTIDTVEQFRQRYPQARLCLIIGSDSLNKLHTWHRYQDLLGQVNCVVLHRPGAALAVGDDIAAHITSRVADLQSATVGNIYLFAHSHFDISSTQLRAELANNPSNSALVEEFLPPEVIRYIQQQQLYKNP